VAEALANELGGAVNLSEPVRRIAWSANGERVGTEQGSYEADAVVLAVPASVTGKIEFDPPLPDAKRAALDAVVYGQVAKLFLRLKEPVPPSATLSVPGRFWCYTQLGPDGRPLPIVASFAGTSAVLQALEAERGPERWASELAELRPDLMLDTSSALTATWHDDPWALGGYSARSLRSPMDDDELARPVGCLAFAGEHTAGDWHGLMEGALRSGMRAAKELVGAASESA
jgi:monoamine oxidase